MSEVADIVKTAYEIFKDNQNVEIKVANPSLGMAYAIPKGSESTVFDDYGPWLSAEMKNVFYRQSALGAVMAEIQLILSWKYSQAKQYIVEVYLDKNIIGSLDTTHHTSIDVRFEHPQQIGNDIDEYKIPFLITVNFGNFLGAEDEIYKGEMRADGTGTFELV